ncbi:anti-sigma-V factor rsiV [Falsibacillus pallidus]|uniref:Uncharacterized protein DUF4163 n=1 Tax=Falsibacillus pallidus TaxID=493781 RepID=A0A370G1F7_9BACI|nr:anti-sigma-V factor rsiV [Falsibacillus pallidus]RDI36444.1 uncharacterized protein DUF4163 [Falsibacillus pallidus]
MGHKLEKMREEYKNIPIPDELDMVVDNAIKQSRKRKKRTPLKWIGGSAAAAIIFCSAVLTNSAFAHTLSDVPIVGSLVKLITSVEYKINYEHFQADLKTPAIKNLKNKKLEEGLNKKYLEENKKLYEEFQKDIKEMKEAGMEGHMGLDTGYEVKTDNKKILSIGRYVVNTAGSSSTTFTFDTIDKQKQLLITLPSLFKDDSYVDVITANIKEQMIEQMKKPEDGKIYWVNYPGGEEVMPGMEFKKIKKEQNFYINGDNKLVISFNKYDVAPGYMGVPEFIIPTDAIQDVLVSNEYIR